MIEILTSTPGIQHLDLKSNRLTHNIIPLLDFPSLLSLDLSFNPLGPEALAKLPQGLEIWTSIKKIKLIYCDFGGYFRITDEILASYDNAGKLLWEQFVLLRSNLTWYILFQPGSKPRDNLSIDLTDNAFGDLMRGHWQPLLEKLVCDCHQIEM